MKPVKSTIIAACVALSAGAFSMSATAADVDAEAAIAAAKEAQMQANSVGGEWRDTAKMIKRAEKLLKEGKHQEAAAMAQKAEAQGMLGYMQATSQTADKLHI